MASAAGLAGSSGSSSNGVSSVPVGGLNGAGGAPVHPPNPPNPPPPTQVRKRISYVLPTVEGDVPQWFRLPTLDEATRLRKGRSTPLLYPAPSQSRDAGAYATSSSFTSAPSSSKNPFRASMQAADHPRTSRMKRKHPRHVLPVSSLALDATTVLGGPNSDGMRPQGILYTGGRDGLIGAWELGLEMQPRERGERVALGAAVAAPSLSTIRQDRSEEAQQSKWQVMQPRASAQTGRRLLSSPGSAKFRQCIGSHTDWINDIVLCNNNQIVISASSDGVVKAWSPHDRLGATTPQVLGYHRDYVKALAHAPNAGWVASGGFDKVVKLWDVGQSRTEPIVELPESLVKSSVYALSTNSSGTVIAAGSPEKVVRVWDPRSGQQVSQLVGHTDNVRSVVVSQDGRHLLSASSDCTVRLWSLSEQRCLHTFTHHDDSVWTLFSDHPNLDVFYSGDRAGYVCKVDWERCAEVAEGECVVLARETSLEGEQPPFSQSPAVGAAGIHKIVAMDDAFVWTASANSRVSRWQDVPRRADREVMFPLHRPSVSSSIGGAGQASNRTTASRHHSGQQMTTTATSFSERKANGTTSSSTAAVPPSSDINQRSDANMPPSVPSLFGIPFDSLVCLAPPDDALQAAIGIGSVSLRQATSTIDQHGRPENLFSSASLISIPSALRSVSGGQKSSYDEMASKMTPAQHRPASIRFAASSPPAGDFAEEDEEEEEEEEAEGGEKEDDDETEGEDTHDTRLLEARQAYEERELVTDAKPLNVERDDVIEGAHGFIRSSMLKDRRHVLTIDTAGTICLWDIVAGRCLGGFRWHDVQNAAATAAAAANSEAQDHLLPNEALEVVKEHIEGEAAVPLWCTVDTKIGKLTVHLEHPRCFDAEIYLDECFDVVPDIASNCKEDQRANAGKWVLRNLFGGFVDAEMKLRGGEGPSLKSGTLALEKPEIVRKQSLRLPLAGLTQTTGIGSPSEKLRTPGMTLALAVAPETPALVPEGPAPLTPTEASAAILPSLAEVVAGLSARNGSGAAAADYFSLQKGQEQQADAPTTPLSRNASTIKTSTSAEPMPQSPSAGSSGLMGRLRMGLGKSKNAAAAAAAAAASNAAGDNAAGSKNGAGASTSDDTETSTTESAHLTWLRHILSRPINAPSLLHETPAINYDGQTAILISESPPSQHDSTGAWHVVYRGLVSTTIADVEALELLAPPWLVDLLLANRLSLANNAAATTQAGAKISFTLQPWKPKGPREGLASPLSPSSSPSKRLEEAQTQSESDGVVSMPAMPSGNARLTATRMLRMKKVCAYVCEKLQVTPAAAKLDDARSRAPSIVAASIQGSRRPSTESSSAPTSPHPAAAAILPPLTQIRASTNTAASEAAGRYHEEHELTPIETVEILCNDVVLSPHATLAQVQRFAWKGPMTSDVKLEYRWANMI